MRIARSMAVAASLVLACTTTIARAQEAAPPAAGTTIAVVGVSLIFKNHAEFIRQMDAMKAEVQAFEQEMQRMRLDIQTKQQLLQTFQPGTPDYQNVQREVAQIAADVQARTTVKGDELRQREAAIYLETYQQIVASIDTYTTSHEIDLVLRYNSEGVDPNDPESILRLVNSQVVLQRNLDITEAILAMVNQPAAPPAATD